MGSRDSKRIRNKLKEKEMRKKTPYCGPRDFFVLVLLKKVLSEVRKTDLTVLGIAINPPLYWYPLGPYSSDENNEAKPKE